MAQFPFTIIAFAAFQSSQTLEDLAALIVIGIRQGKQILGRDSPPVIGRRAPLLFLLAVTV